MTKLDDRIRQLVHEMAESAPVLDDWPATAPRPRVNRERRRTLATATAVVAVVAVAGAAGTSAWRRSAAISHTVAAVGPADTRDPAGVGVGGQPPSQPDRTLARSIDLLGPDEWPFPAWLPAGFDFEYAITSPDTRQIRFVDVEDRSFTIDISPLEIPPPSDVAEQLERSESSWVAVYEGSYVTRTENGWLQVWGEDLKLDVMLEILGSLSVVDSDGLPRPPIDYTQGPYTAVATSTQNGRPAVLSVTTDGTFYALRTTWGDESHFGVGCCSALAEGEFIKLTGGSGRIPIENGPPGGEQGLIHGIVHRSVASVEIRLKDGAVVRAVPQDAADSFPVNFLFVAVPDPDDDILDAYDVVIAFDAEGNELGRSK